MTEHQAFNPAAVGRPGIAGLIRIFLLAALVLTPSGGAAVAAASDKHINLNSNGFAIHGHDPVAYFTEGRPVRGSKSFTAAHGGAKYAFASAANRAMFLVNPEKYTPQYGGHCAYGLVHGSKSDIDPGVWEIVDDRLYFLINPGTKSIWRRRTKSHIRTADKAWESITGSN